MNLQLMTTIRRHRCANVRPHFRREIWNYYRLASSGVSMTAVWERAVGRWHYIACLATTSWHGFVFRIQFRK